MARPEDSLAVLLGVSQLLYLATVLALGLRLSILASRNRQLPEILLAVHFVLCATVGYVLLGVGVPASYEPGMLSPEVMALLIGGGHLASSVGVFAGAAFNYFVFRRGKAWARGLLWLGGLTLSTGYIGYAMSGGFRDGRCEGIWFWLLYGTYTAAAAWVMTEPFAHYYGVMRKHLRLGLVEPLVANRFLLWGGGSVCRFIMLIMGGIPSIFFRHLSPAEWQALTSITLTFVALAGFGVSVTYWLTFFPTPAYKRFLQRRHESAGDEI